MKISLDQWSALVAVVEHGGYAKAGERLHKSQSTLTYAVQKLESQLGLKAFEIQGRRAVLTPAGQTLYRRGKSLIEEAARLEHAATQLAKGLEPEIRLAVEILFPTWLLLECFAAFAAERPECRIELVESVLGGTDEALAAREVDLAIGSRVPTGFVGDPLMPVRFVCAAAPDHPLHRLGRELTLEDLRAHRHLIIRDSGVQRTRGVDGWQNELRWTLTSKATSIRAAKMGLGYAWYSEEIIREELGRGELQPLPLREGASRLAQLYLIYPDRDAAGPGTLRLAAIIKSRVERDCRDARGKRAAEAPA